MAGTVCSVTGAIGNRVHGLRELGRVKRMNTFSALISDALFLKSKLLEALAELADPRRRKWEHSLEELLLVAICVVGSGAESWTSVSEWGQLKLCLPYFKHLHSGHGFASRDWTASV